MATATRTNKATTKPARKFSPSTGKPSTKENPLKRSSREKRGHRGNRVQQATTPPPKNEEARLTKFAEMANEHFAAAMGAARTELDHAIKAGEALLAAKRALIKGMKKRKQQTRGAWGEWLKKNFKGAARTAQDWMQLAKTQDHVAVKKAAAEDIVVSSIKHRLSLVSKKKATISQSNKGKKSGNISNADLDDKEDDTGEAAVEDAGDESETRQRIITSRFQKHLADVPNEALECINDQFDILWDVFMQQVNELRKKLAQDN